MASSASPSRKRKSSSNDLDSGSSSRKKSKDSERDASKDSSQSKRTKPKSKKDIKAGLKTVSELAKLVTSGAVQVPKSLVHYASDKALLLDQVFTILSPSDVNGMLPDILKGLRIKRIKSLCYEQLKRMSVEEITRALQQEETTPVDVSTTEMTSSEANQTPLIATVNKPKEFIEKPSEEKVGQTAQVLSGECHKKGRNTPNPDPCSESKEVLNSPQDTSRQPSKDEIILHVSDISVEEVGKRDSKLAGKPREGERLKGRKHSDTSNNYMYEPVVLKEEYVITSLRVATHKKQNSNKEHSETKVLIESQDIKMEKETTDTSDVIRNDGDVINKDDVMSEVDTCEGLAIDEAVCSESENSDEGSDLDVEVSELDATKLLEMEMRRRALESELKKFSQNTDQTTKLRSRTSLADDCSASDDEECNFLALHVSESEMLGSQSQSSRDNSKQKTVSLKQHESRDTGVNEVKTETDTMDVGQLLEMKLRQKALQSLLHKKKQTSLTQ